MDSNNGQLSKDNSSQIPDETIRRFLLGGLEAAEQTTFERQLMLDQALGARVRLAELELADDYAYKRLSTSERELADKAFLLGAERARKVRVSLLLQEKF